jgi:hypothetical protein
MRCIKLQTPLCDRSVGLRRGGTGFDSLTLRRRWHTVLALPWPILSQRRSLQAHTSRLTSTLARRVHSRFHISMHHFTWHDGLIILVETTLTPSLKHNTPIRPFWVGRSIRSTILFGLAFLFLSFWSFYSLARWIIGWSSLESRTQVDLFVTMTEETSGSFRSFLQNVGIKSSSSKVKFMPNVTQPTSGNL